MGNQASATWSTCWTRWTPRIGVLQNAAELSRSILPHRDSYCDALSSGSSSAASVDPVTSSFMQRSMAASLKRLALAFHSRYLSRLMSSPEIRRQRRLRIRAINKKTGNHAWLCTNVVKALGQSSVLKGGAKVAREKLKCIRSAYWPISSCLSLRNAYVQCDQHRMLHESLYGSIRWLRDLDIGQAAERNQSRQSPIPERSRSTN